MVIVVVLRSVLRHPGPGLQALRIGAVQGRGRQQADQLGGHVEQDLVAAHPGVELVHQGFVGTRCQGAGLEVAAAGFGQQAADHGVDHHLLDAAVGVDALGVVAHGVEADGGQGV